MAKKKSAQDERILTLETKVELLERQVKDLTESLQKLCEEKPGNSQPKEGGQ